MKSSELQVGVDYAYTTDRSYRYRQYERVTVLAVGQEGQPLKSYDSLGSKQKGLVKVRLIKPRSRRLLGQGKTEKVTEVLVKPSDLHVTWEQHQASLDAAQRRLKEREVQVETEVVRLNQALAQVQERFPDVSLPSNMGATASHDGQTVYGGQGKFTTVDLLRALDVAYLQGYAKGVRDHMVAR